MSLTEPYDNNNIFAKIIRGDIPSAKVTETEDTMTIMDAFPQSDGHALVIPKSGGATNMLNVAPETLSAMILETQRVAKAVQAALSPDGVKIVQFNGAPAGQSVFHIHIHVIPVWDGVPLGQHGGGMADPAVLQATAEKIAAHL